MVMRATVALLATGAMFLCIGSALADPPGRDTVDFTLTPDVCSQLAAGQVLTGQGIVQFHQSPGGTFHVVIDGTATDNMGNSWGFEYNDNVRPLPDGSVQITDHFNLTGGGGSLQVLKLHSHFTIVFDQDGNPVSIKQVTGDPVGCDPI